MVRLLHLDASARRASHSRALSRAYADQWRTTHPEGMYTYRDLAADPVPQIDEAWTEICDYALTHGLTDPDRVAEGVRTAAQRRAWAVVEPLLTELVRADVLLIGTPMYNFSVPASLKAWIDQVTFPHASLDVKVVVASARGGTYASGTAREPYEHQERYLRHFFHGHFRVDDVTVVSAELVNATVDPTLRPRHAEYEESYAEAMRSLIELAAASTATERAAADSTS